MLFLFGWLIIQTFYMMSNAIRDNIYCIHKYYDYSFTDEGILVREKIKALDCPKYRIDVPLEWYDSFQIDLFIIGAIIFLAISWTRYQAQFYKTKGSLQIKTALINTKYYDIFPNQLQTMIHYYYSTVSQSYSLHPSNSFLTGSDKKIIFLNKVHSEPQIKYLDYDGLKRFIQKHNSIKIESISISNHYLVKKYTGSKYVYCWNDSESIISTSKNSLINNIVQNKTKINWIFLIIAYLLTGLYCLDIASYPVKYYHLFYSPINNYGSYY